MDLAKDIKNLNLFLNTVDENIKAAGYLIFLFWSEKNANTFALDIQIKKLESKLKGDFLVLHRKSFRNINLQKTKKAKDGTAYLAKACTDNRQAACYFLKVDLLDLLPLSGH